jgi:hypothetical protein
LQASTGGNTENRSFDELARCLLLLGPELKHFGRRHVRQFVVIVLELDEFIIGSRPAENVTLQQARSVGHDIPAALQGTSSGSLRPSFNICLSMFLREQSIVFVFVSSYFW